MKTVVTILQTLVRLCFVILLVLGIAFWTGHGLSYIPLHMIVGIVLVVSLWLTSIIAATVRVPVGLVIVGLIWGLIVIGLGMKQEILMPGPYHWVIQVLHLLVGMGAIGLNERLAGFARERLSASATSS